jgi:putative drug exporter of the RND superfamily
MTALTGFVLRHRLVVIVFWLVVTALGAATVTTTIGRMSTSFDLPGTPARDTAQQIAAAYRVDASSPPDVVVLTLPAGVSVDTPGARQRIATAFDAVRRLGGRPIGYPDTGDRTFVTAGGRATFALVLPPPGGAFAPGLADRFGDAVRAAAPAGATVAVTGLGPLQSASGVSEGNGLLAETIIGGVGAVLILAFVFASLVAVLPLVVAAVSILTTFLLVLLVTTVADVNFIAQFIIGLIGLGVAIDYSLLVVTRWREERDRGADNRRAVKVAMARAGRAVVFSGVTVTIGLFALVVLPMPAMRSFGYAGALIPLVSVVVAVTLLPVILDVAGPRLDQNRFRNERTASRPWRGWARLVVRRRWLAAAAGLIALAALAAPVLHLELGEASSAALAQPGPAKDALTRLASDGVPRGLLTPIQVLVRAGAAASTAQRLASVPGVVSASQAADLRTDGTALVTVLPRAEAGDDTGKAIAARVRDAVAHDADVLGVTGEAPSQLDFRDAAYGRFPLMLGLVCLLTFLVLARAFRSLLLPLKAVLINVVSLGAAYGVLVIVWQDGHGSQTVWSTPATGAIALWVPLTVFAFLFGLSMDYEVFLLARMREAHDAEETTDAAVVTGLSRTGRLVTCAALILVLAFVSMSTAPATDVRVLATGLGAGILVDATIVRCLLVPSLVSLLGRWNWWLPAWAARVLRVDPSAAVDAWTTDASEGAPAAALKGVPGRRSVNV